MHYAAIFSDELPLKHICPSQGAVFADKGYCTKPAQKAAATNNVHLAAIKLNNMRDKNKDLDKWRTKIRSPFESVFSKPNKRVRYLGIAKNQFAEFMNAFSFNIKRLAVIS